MNERWRKVKNYTCQSRNYNRLNAASNFDETDASWNVYCHYLRASQGGKLLCPISLSPAAANT